MCPPSEAAADWVRAHSKEIVDAIVAGDSYAYDWERIIREFDRGRMRDVPPDKWDETESVRAILVNEMLGRLTNGEIQIDTSLRAVLGLDAFRSYVYAPEDGRETRVIYFRLPTRKGVKYLMVHEGDRSLYPGVQSDDTLQTISPFGVDGAGEADGLPPRVVQMRERKVEEEGGLDSWDTLLCLIRTNG